MHYLFTAFEYQEEFGLIESKETEIFILDIKTLFTRAIFPLCLYSRHIILRQCFRYTAKIRHFSHNTKTHYLVIMLPMPATTRTVTTPGRATAKHTSPKHAFEIDGV